MMPASVSANSTFSSSDLGSARYEETNIPVTYYKGATQIVTGNFNGQHHVACLLWTDQLAREAAQACSLRSRLEEGKRINEKRHSELHMEEQKSRDKVIERLRTLHRLDLLVARQRKRPSAAQKNELKRLGESWRDALREEEQVFDQRKELERRLKMTEQQYCDVLESIHLLAYNACKKAGMPIESRTLLEAVGNLKAPLEPEQTLNLASESEDGLSSECGQDLIRSVNRKRIRDWKDDTHSGRVLTDEEAHFALSGAEIEIGDSASAVGSSSRKRRLTQATNWRRPNKWRRRSF